MSRSEVKLDTTEFDVIITGTGLVSSLLSAALSRAKLKVLHCDENGYYGCDDASFHLQHFEYLATHRLDKLPNCRFGASPDSKQDTGSIDHVSETDASAVSESGVRRYAIRKAPAVESITDQSADASKTESRSIGNFGNFEWVDFTKCMSSTQSDSSVTTAAVLSSANLKVGSVFRAKTHSPSKKKKRPFGFGRVESVFYTVETVLSESQIVCFKRVNGFAARNPEAGASKSEERYPRQLYVTFVQIPLALEWVASDLRNWSLTDSVRNRFRKVLVDLKPNVMFANGKLVDALITSGVHHYCEFRPVDSNGLLLPDATTGSSRPLAESLVKVPLSKAEVFRSEMTLKEKRSLMKFINALTAHLKADDFTGDGISGGQFVTTATVEEKRQCETVATFDLEKELSKLTRRLADWIRYGIALMDYRPSEDGSAAVGCKHPVDDCRSVLRRLRLFLSSIGKYSPGAFLFPLYGCGELPSAFCRNSAVNGSIFVLSFGLKAYYLTAERITAVETQSGQLLKCKHLITTTQSSIGCGLAEDCEEVIVRMTVLSDAGERVDVCVAHIPAGNEAIGNASTVHCLQIDERSLCVPRGCLLCYFWTVAPNTLERIADARNSLQTCFDRYFATDDVGSRKPLAAVRCIYEQRLRRAPKPLAGSRLPAGIHVVDDCRNDTFGFETQILHASDTFARITESEGRSGAFMEEWPPATEQKSRADEVFAALPEIVDDASVFQ